MATRRLGIIMHGVTGRMGMNQHLIRSIVAIRDAGRRGAGQRRPRDARPDPDRPQCREDRGAGAGPRHRALGHRPRRRAGRTRTTPSSSTPAPRRCARRCWRRRSRAGKHVYCEKPIATNLNEAVEVCRLAARLGPQARRGAGQAVPAGPAQARHAAPRRLLRPHPVGAHRVRLLGVRRRPAADPAAVAGTTAPKTAAASSST